LHMGRAAGDRLPKNSCEVLSPSARSGPSSDSHVQSSPSDVGASHTGQPAGADAKAPACGPMPLRRTLGAPPAGCVVVPDTGWEAPPRRCRRPSVADGCVILSPLNPSLPARAPSDVGRPHSHHRAGKASKATSCEHNPDHIFPKTVHRRLSAKDTAQLASLTALVAVDHRTAFHQVSAQEPCGLDDLTRKPNISDWFRFISLP
jgi:hypothetical protein